MSSPANVETPVWGNYILWAALIQAADCPKASFLDIPGAHEAIRNLGLLGTMVVAMVPCEANFFGCACPTSVENPIGPIYPWLVGSLVQVTEVLRVFPKWNKRHGGKTGGSHVPRQPISTARKNPD